MVRQKDRDTVKKERFSDFFLMSWLYNSLIVSKGVSSTLFLFDIPLLSDIFPAKKFPSETCLSLYLLIMSTKEKMEKNSQSKIQLSW